MAVLAEYGIPDDMVNEFGGNSTVYVEFAQLPRFQPLIKPYPLPIVSATKESIIRQASDRSQVNFLNYQQEPLFICQQCYQNGLCPTKCNAGYQRTPLFKVQT